MQVILADTLGMCFGVRDALAIIAEVQRPHEVTIHGELVHNETVLAQLEERGFHMIQESRRRPLPVTETVLITAHGISDKERRRLQKAGKKLVDTTCPLVERAHHAARKLRDEGYHVLVIGRRGHVEIQGVIEDLESYDVIEGPKEVIEYPHMRLGIMCQTTATESLVAEVRAEIARKNPRAEIHFSDTVCHPTKDHQRALERLLEQVETVVVVGGRNSNNTRQLVARCLEKGLVAYHVQGAADLDPAWFEGVDRVGLTAGTSTLAETIHGVHEALLGMRVDSDEFHPPENAPFSREPLASAAGSARE